MMDFHKQYQTYLNFFEQKLNDFCAEMDFSTPVLKESMAYSLLSGGKRVRPVLFLSTLDALGIDYTKEINFALAIECIHTYSLIHDDLPAMDNDDYRRGRFSNHKVFGEANAILAGDGLLSLASSILLNEGKRGERYLIAAQTLMEAAGPNGMIAGQSADLYYSEKQAGKKEILFIYQNKTAKLITAPLVMAAQIAEKPTEIFQDFGNKLGILFQLTDDILDVKGDSSKMGKTLGKDDKEGKLTFIRIYGLQKSEQIAKEYAENCMESLNKLDINREFLHEFVRYISDRES